MSSLDNQVGGGEGGGGHSLLMRVLAMDDGGMALPRLSVHSVPDLQVHCTLTINS